MPIYSSSDITTLKLYTQPDGSEKVYRDAYLPMNSQWIEIPRNVPSVKEYFELVVLAETNETVRLHLEHLKTVYGLSRD